MPAQHERELTMKAIMLISTLLLHPAKKEFDLPSLLVQSAHRDGRQVVAVGQEDEPLAGVGVAVADAAPGKFNVRRATPPLL